MSGLFCSSTAGCGPAGGVCVFPVLCNPGDCVGDVTCGERHIVVDYCAAAIAALPSPNGQN